MHLYVIETGFFKLDGGAMFGVVPKTMWQKLNPPDENNLCTWAMRCLLVQTANRLTLIDTGIGNKQDEKFRSHFHPHGEDTLLHSLKKHGFATTDITDVVLTHLHFDHCGGAVSRLANGDLVPTFPNARYWTNAEHWATATQPNAREKASFLPENILPLHNHQVLHFAQDGQSLFDGFSVHFVYGHTQAMMLPKIRYGNRNIIYTADLIPSSSHVRLPYVMAYDMQPLYTLSEKETYLKQAAEHNDIFFFEHDPICQSATIRNTEKGYEIDQKGNLHDLLHS